MTNKPAIPHPRSSSFNNSVSISPLASLRELLESLTLEQRRNQELLISLSFALRSFTNINRFLELVPIVASRLVGVEGSLLIPFHSNGRIWREQLEVFPSDHCQELFRQLLVMQESIDVGFGSEEKQTMILDGLVQRHLTQSLVFATSIVARGRQRGRLYVFGNDQVCFASEVHKKHLQLVADMTAVAIENDLIFQEIRRHERVDRQLSIGAEIQAQLLPDRCPVVEGIQLAACCRPAFQVGGDYYDFMPTRPELTGRRRERGRWAFVIGDVMGKGVPAGLLMTMLRGMLRAEVLSGLSPDRILHDLNQLALDDLAQSHRFVTLFYSDFDAGSRKLRFANAAHNPPLLWSSKSKCVTRLDVPGVLIGLQPEAEYSCGEITLDYGDVLLYYTDGVTEAPGLSGDRFGEDRLIKLLDALATADLGAKQILDKLFRRLDGFVGTDHQLEDDASIVVLKVNNELNLPVVN